MSDLNEIIEKHALINAVTHEGKANSKAVLKKLIAEVPEIRESVRDAAKRNELFQQIEQIVTNINEMSLDEQQRILQEKYGITVEYIIEEKAKKTRIGLPPLPNADKIKQVVTRFAPAPSGALHLGQLIRAAFLSYLYARMYDGKFILRIEDTDPRRIKKIYYEWILEDLKAVGIEWDELVYESDHFDAYYEYTRKLFEMQKAYVCTCTTEEFKEYKEKKMPCPHRDTMDTIDYWEKMLQGKYMEGEAVVRLKTDMTHPNPAVRDPPLLRIVDSIPHPRTGYKYRIYPLYNYACAIEDYMSKVTHVIRGKEHETNEAIQHEIYLSFGWKPPITIQYGMLKLPELKIHKRYIRTALKEGKIKGWDDVTLPTVRALLRRGIHPETFKKMAFHIGMTKSEATISLETLYAFNRQILSPIAKRISFVEDPFVMKIIGVPREEIEVNMPWIPGDNTAGYRSYKLRAEKSDKNENILIVYLSSSDINILESARRSNAIVRLKDLSNVIIEKIDTRKKEIRAKFHSFPLVPGVSKLHWVPYEELAINACVIMPDGSERRGLVELLAQQLPVGEYVQLERFGFGRVDDNQGELITFTYAHP